MNFETPDFLLRQFLSCFCFLNLISFSGYSQHKGNANFLQLDKSLIQWKEFSFAQPWNKLKSTCDLQKVDGLSPDYLEFYCGDVADTTKSYLFRSEQYHQFASFHFDQVVLHVCGHPHSPVNYSKLSFVKQLSDALASEIIYKALLDTLKSKYGRVYTDRAEKMAPGKVAGAEDVGKNWLNDRNPFSAVEESTWEGGDNFYMSLYYMRENNLIILTFSEYFEACIINPRLRNLFLESEYDEKMTDVFKEFDKSNGYKGLKFGQSKLSIKNLATLKGPSAENDYEVVTESYHKWFDTQFDLCNVRFNKRGLFYNLTLLKASFSDDEYTRFLSELTDLFGQAARYKIRSDATETSIWQGQHMEISILRNLGNESLYIDFTSPKLDDSSPTDKLY
jgi:hypothetical protein